MTVAETALQAWTAHNLPDGLEPGLESTSIYDPPNFSWPAGCHIAVVEVDTETGDATGRALHRSRRRRQPCQPDGGCRPGSRRRGHRASRRPCTRRPCTTTMATSLTDRWSAIWSRARQRCPRTRSITSWRPVPTNPLGVKGVGETGAIASTPAVINAVVDALSHLGVQRHRHARISRESLARDRGGDIMIPAAFDYEVAESVDQAIALLGAEQRRQVARGRALAVAAHAAPLRAAGSARRHRPHRGARVHPGRRGFDRDRRDVTPRGRRCRAPSSARDARSLPRRQPRSAIPRFAIAARSVAPSLTRIRRLTCRRCCSRSTRSW